MTNAATRTPPIDAPSRAQWFSEAVADDDANAGRAKGGLLSADDVRNTWGPALVHAFFFNAELRHEYYRLSFSWHIEAFANSNAGGNSLSGGRYGDQWCGALEEHLRDVWTPSGTASIPSPLGLADFANLHRFLFYSLRRAVFDQTCHDIDPESEALLSFHMVPNDQDAQGMTPGSLGLSVRSGP
jgi:hypothetical protein